MTTESLMNFFKVVLPDTVAVAGIAFLGYGLFLFKPWVSYSTSGFLILVYTLHRTNRMPNIDVRDVMFIVGLSGFGYGLFLKDPWIAFSACGFILMLSGYLMRDK